MFEVTDPTWSHVPSPAHALLDRLEAALAPVPVPVTTPPPAPSAPPPPPEPMPLAVWSQPTPVRAPRNAVGARGGLTANLRLPGWRTPL